MAEEKLSARLDDKKHLVDEGSTLVISRSGAPLF